MPTVTRQTAAWRGYCGTALTNSGPGMELSPPRDLALSRDLRPATLLRLLRIVSFPGTVSRNTSVESARGGVARVLTRGAAAREAPEDRRRDDGRALPRRTRLTGDGRAAPMATDTPRTDNVPRDWRDEPSSEHGEAGPGAAVAAGPGHDAAAVTDDRALAHELRQQARAVGDRLKESLNGQVTGRVVRSVGRLIRQLGHRRPPAGPAPTAPVPVVPSAGAECQPPEDAPSVPVAPLDEAALLAQFRQRREAREARRSQRRRDRDAAAATVPADPPPSVAEPPVASAAAHDSSPAAGEPPTPASDAAVTAMVPATGSDSHRLPLSEGPFQLPPVDLLSADETVAAADPEEIGGTGASSGDSGQLRHRCRGRNCHPWSA